MEVRELAVGVCQALLDVGFQLVEEVLARWRLLGVLVLRVGWLFSEGGGGNTHFRCHWLAWSPPAAEATCGGTAIARVTGGRAGCKEGMVGWLRWRRLD